MVVDYSVANAQVELVPPAVVLLEQEAVKLVGATALCLLGLVQEYYWRCTVEAAAKDFFTIGTRRGCSRRRESSRRLAEIFWFGWF